MRARRSYRVAFILAIAAAIVSLSAAGAVAQSLGTFRWQLVPFCNVVTLAVTQNAGVFEVEGSDDQCGATGTQASAIGTAFFNPNGTVGIGLNIVSTPGGVPVHVDVTVTVATLGGTWRDSAGQTGTFVFTPGPGTGGTPRPAPTNHIAPGSVGSAHIDPAQVQRRVADSCSVGSFVRSIGEDGSVECGFDAGDISAVTAGSGLAGGGTAGSVQIELPRTASGAFELDNLNGFVAAGIFGAGLSPPVSGPGSRAMWYPGKVAFRAGSVAGTQWDDSNIGYQSVAFGSNTIASGTHTMAVGDRTIASGGQSVAMGYFTTASGVASFAMGYRSQAGGSGSVALGTGAITAAPGSFVFADQSGSANFASPAANEFGVRAAGGVYLYTSANLSTGCSLPAGSGAWQCASDRNSKESFEPVDGEAVLTKLRAMPIERWSYRSEPGVTHIGPVAQDFHAAFGLGVDDKSVGHLDLSGISLRAIQALEERTRALMQENAALKERLERLEATRR